MQKYLISKLTEHKLILKWIEQEIKNLQINKLNHNYLIGLLKSNISELWESHKLLKKIIRNNDKQLLRRAPTIIHRIEYRIFIITYYYLPILKKEDRNDLFLRKLIFSMIEYCGLFWIKDVLVHLQGPHATFLGLTEVPIIFSPPQQIDSFVDMVNLYHELGHNVFQYFKEIGDNLSTTVSKYFSKLRSQAGIIKPEEKELRDQVIREAENYWREERLNEIFADILATYVCGPAYYFTCVDTAIRISRNPFHVSPTDAHPPSAARVYACYRALLPIYQNNKYVKLLQKIWDTYTYNQRSPDFNIKCAGILIDRLVNQSIKNIKHLVKQATRYSKDISDLSWSKKVSSSERLETILNKRIIILLMKPEFYKEWEREVFKIFSPNESRKISKSHP